MTDRARRFAAIVLALSATFVLWACASGANGDPVSTPLPGPGATKAGAGAETAVSSYSFRRYVRNVDQALGLTFDTRGRLLYAEKDTGRIIRFSRGRKKVLAKLGVSGGGEPGLLGLTVADNGDFFAYYTSASASCPNPLKERAGGSLDGLCVWRFKPGSDGRLAADGLVFSAGHPSSATNHVGGGIDIGADGALYLSIGDLGENDDPDSGPLRAQSLSVPYGKILRLDPNGRNDAADGNPGSCGNVANSTQRDAGDKRIWACGLRNTYRFAFDREGVMWGAESGDSCDEINRIFESVNYGWESGRTDCSGTGSGKPVLEVRGTPSGITVPVAAAARSWRNDVLFCRFSAGGVLMRYDQASKRLSEVGKAAGRCLFDMTSRGRFVFISSGDAIYRLAINR